MLLKNLYYRLTADMSRSLPTNESEYKNFKEILVKYFAVPDECESWILVAGQVTSTEAHKLKKSYLHIANAAKRIKINKLAGLQRGQAFKDLQTKFAQQSLAVAEQAQAETDMIQHEAPEGSEAAEQANEIQKLTS